MKDKGISICLTSAKGGVGKTVMTTNLAGLYEVLKKRVLIIDFDLSSGCINTILNKPASKNIYNFVDDYNNNRYQDFKNYVTKYDDYIDILASPKDPRQARKIEPKYVEIILDKAIFNYDVVLIDTNNDLNDFNILTMDVVDKILFLITNDPMDLKNMRSLIAVLKDIDYDNYRIILNESINPYKSYFSLYDIKNIIKSNVDYVVSKEFFIKNIDSFIMEGKVITLDDRVSTLFSKDYTTMMRIITDIYDEENKNET